MPLSVDRTDVVGTIWTLTDQQGTVRDLVGKWADDPFRLEHVTYTPFGVPTPTGGLSGLITTFYAGHVLDRFTGLYFNRARWYDPSGKRFLSEDPIYADINLYRYAGNNPTNATDPTGHRASFLNDPLDWAFGYDAALWDVSGSQSLGGSGYRFVGEGFRSVLGDEYLSQAGGWELLGVTSVAATAGVLGGLAGVGIAGVAGLGAFGTVVTAGAFGGGTEYLGMTLTASAFNAAYDYGGNPHPTVGGFAVSVVGGGISGGLFHGGSLVAGAGTRATLRSLSTGARGSLTNTVYRGLLNKGVGGRILPKGLAPKTAEVITRGRVSGYREIMQKARAAKSGDVSALGEIEAAKVLRAQGRNVHFQTPIGRRGPNTADFLVDGVPFDVYTPVTRNPGNVIKGIFNKDNQAPNILLNLRHTPVRAGELGDILFRVNNFHPDFPGRIRSVEII